MDLYEHQAKELFAAHGVPVPTGTVVTTPDQAFAAAAAIGGRVVVKAQVKAGGRGKAGGVKVADDPDHARAEAGRILGMDIKGHTVHTVLVEQASDIAEEYYASYLLDRSGRSFLAMCSREGGMEIEEVAATKPEALARVPVDPLDGVDVAAARRIAADGGLPEAALDGAAELLAGLWRVFVGTDATLVEVNPLILTGDGRVMALDGKVTLDDNAAYRHGTMFAEFADSGSLDPLEARARERHLNYVKLDGQVGIIGNGAGLVMSTLDVVANAGASHGVRPANFLDIGGGASAQVMADGLEIILSDPQVRAVLVNVFGGITACDAVANGIVQAIAMLTDRGDDIDRPIVCRLDGNNAAQGRRILAESARDLVEMVETMDGAAQRVAELAARGA